MAQAQAARELKSPAICCACGTRGTLVEEAALSMQPQKANTAVPEDESKSELQPLVPHDEFAKRSAVYLVGAALVLVALLAVAVQQEVMQSSQSHGNVDKPSMTIWWNHTCLTLGLPLGLLLQCRRECSASPSRLWRRLLERQGWSPWQALGLCTTLAAVFLLPNLAWAISLKSVWVPLVTAASRFDTVFVLLFTSIWTWKAPPWKQALSVLACILGVILISFGQKDPTNGQRGGTRPWEFVEVFISPCFSALYSLLFNRLASGVAEDAGCLCAMLGLIGLCNAVLLWPVVPICEAAGLEQQRLRDVLTTDGLRSIFLNAALATVGNFSTMPAVALTSPLFVSLGMLLLMPVTVLIDWLFMHHTTLNAVVIGSLAICCGSGYSTAAEASEKSAAPVPPVEAARGSKLLTGKPSV
uniref:EamA domain-containing protein n=1 Tax=Alexandrium monilatum TaxID=311494 RepID=A0A7S4UCU5_9DINO